MSRFPNVRGRKDRKPRNKHVMFHILTTAHSLYIETGGADIDFNIQSARDLVSLCRERASQSPTEKGGDPLKLMKSALTELRLAEQLRERKLKECREILAETTEAEEESPPEEPAEPQPSEPQPVEPETPGKPLEPTAAAETPEQHHDQTGS
ncbi:MAG: hypothetical protein H6839_01280 [Planctomycetes bacterium]|nr:hypothetical protein [Planctomycetota bacterium]